MKEKYETFLKLAKLKYCDALRQLGESTDGFDEYWFCVESSLREATNPDGFQELCEQARLSPEEFQRGIKEERDEDVSLEVAEMHVSCSGLAVGLIQSSGLLQEWAIEDGLLESVAGKVIPTGLGADALSGTNKPLEIFGIRFNDVSQFKRALMIVKKLLNKQPDLTDEEVQGRLLKALEHDQEY
jgi:hypothetical protein